MIVHIKSHIHDFIRYIRFITRGALKDVCIRLLFAVYLSPKSQLRIDTTNSTFRLTQGNQRRLNFCPSTDSVSATQRMNVPVWSFLKISVVVCRGILWRGQSPDTGVQGQGKQDSGRGVETPSRFNFRNNPNTGKNASWADNSVPAVWSACRASPRYLYIHKKYGKERYDTGL